MIRPESRRRVVRFALLVALIAGPVVARAAAPGPATVDDEPVYSLELRLDADRLSGRARVTVPAAAVDGGVVRFDVAGNGIVLRLARVATGAGRPLEHGGPDAGGVVEVRLPDPGDAREIVLEYDRPIDATHLEPFGYLAFAPFGPGNWAYPELLLPDGQAPRFADFDVVLDHPYSWSVLTTGGHGGDGRIADGRVSVRTGAAHVEGFAIIAGEGFVVSRHETGGVTVVAFYHPDHAERFSRVVDATGEAVAWYRDTYGFFPLEEVGIIQGHPRWGGGYPLPNLYAFHLGILDDDHITWITAHELGHYYWGLYVLGDGERLDWLQLALGIWSDQLYLARRNGRTLPEQWRSGKRQGDWFTDWLEAVVAGREQRLGLDSTGLDFDYNSLIRHGKAATGLYLQSMLLGPDRFLDLQRGILASHRHRALTEDELVGLLVDAGLDGAPAFFDAWRQDDARIEVAVSSVEPTEGGWRVALQRTGSVPYPVEVEITDESGVSIRHVMAAEASEDAVVVAARPASVRLDPDGVVPMWNSSHPGIRSAYARALERAGIDGAFLALAPSVLAEAPDDDYLRYRLARRHFTIGRWDDAAGLWPPDAACDGYDACLAALYAARARARGGEVDTAGAMLQRLEAGAREHGATALWEIVRGELSSSPDGQ